MKKVTELEEHEVIFCKTQEEWNQIIKMNPKNGLNNFHFDIDWLCYRPKGMYGEGAHSSKRWYESVYSDNGLKYTIYNASDFLRDSDKETKIEKPIDKVTTDLLDIALRICDIHIAKSQLDNIIDVFELLEDKGDNATIKDFEDLKDNWK